MGLFMLALRDEELSYYENVITFIRDSLMSLTNLNESLVKLTNLLSILLTYR